VPSDTPVGHKLPDALEYQRRAPETTVLYRAVQRHLESFLAFARDQARVVPRFVERELRAFLDCGLLCRGFLRVRCQERGRELQILAKLGRTEGCPFCHSDLKCCLNCRLRDPGANNQCLEPQVEWVTDKDKASFCEFFEFRVTSPLSQPGSGGAQSEASHTRAAFDSLSSKKR
jgi:hypothetical protein